MPSISTENLDKRYTIAAETRNLLVAASQNVYAALRYLPNIELPYCSMNEIEILDKAITYIFTDMATPDRFSHALECYTSTLKRISALRQWINQVIKTTIARDLFEVQETCKQKEIELREERIRLIRARVESITGVPLESLQNTTPSSDLRGEYCVDYFNCFFFAFFSSCNYSVDKSFLHRQTKATFNFI